MGGRQIDALVPDQRLAVRFAGGGGRDPADEERWRRHLDALEGKLDLLIKYAQAAGLAGSEPASLEPMGQLT